MNEKDIDKLEEVLREAYRSREVPAAGDSWQAGVMRRIGWVAAGEEETESIWPLFTRLAWRFSLVASVVAVILAIIVLKTELFPAREIAMMMLEDPVSLFISPPSVI